MHRLVAAMRRSIRAALTTAEALATAVRGRRHSLLVALFRAIDRGTPVRIGYVKADGTASVRVIEPAKLWPSDAGNILLRAYDHRDGEDRTFRVDRITAYQLCA